MPLLFAVFSSRGRNLLFIKNTMPILEQYIKGTEMSFVSGPNCAHQGVVIKHGETYRPDNYTMCRCPDSPFSLGLSGIELAVAICVKRQPDPAPIVVN